MAALRVAPPIVGEIPNGIGTEIRINARHSLSMNLHFLTKIDGRPTARPSISDRRFAPVLEGKLNAVGSRPCHRPPSAITLNSTKTRGGGAKVALPYRNS